MFFPPICQVQYPSSHLKLTSYTNHRGHWCVYSPTVLSLYIRVFLPTSPKWSMIRVRKGRRACRDPHHLNLCFTTVYHFETGIVAHIPHGHLA